MRNKESEFVVVFGLNSISGNWNLKVILFVNRPTIDKSKQPIAASISRATIAIVWAVTGWHDTELLTLHQPITRSAHALIGYFLSHCHPPPLMWHPVQAWLCYKDLMCCFVCPGLGFLCHCRSSRDSLFCNAFLSHSAICSLLYCFFANFFTNFLSFIASYICL